MTDAIRLPVVLARRDAPGCYYDAEDGSTWAAFALMMGSAVACAACTGTIRTGYYSTADGDEVYLCLSCVTTIKSAKGRRPITQPKMEPPPVHYHLVQCVDVTCSADNRLSDAEVQRWRSPASGSSS